MGRIMYVCETCEPEYCGYQDPTDLRLHEGEQLCESCFDAKIEWPDDDDKEPPRWSDLPPIGLWAPLPTNRETLSASAEPTDSGAVLETVGDSSPGGFETDMSSESEKSGAAEPHFGADPKCPACGWTGHDDWWNCLKEPTGGGTPSGTLECGCGVTFKVTGLPGAVRSEPVPMPELAALMNPKFK